MTRTTRTPAADPLADLRAAIWQHITITDVAVSAMKAAGAETDEVKSLVLRTYMAKRANPTADTCTDAMLKAAEKVLALRGAGSKGEGKKRTQEQERHYAAARQYLKSLRAKAGVEASDNRGGANNTGNRAPRTPDGTEPDAAEKYDTEPKVRAHIAHVAATLMAFLEKHKDVCTDATRRPVAVLVKAVSGWAAKPE